MVQRGYIQQRHLWGKANLTMATSIFTYNAVLKSTVALSGLLPS